MMLLSILTSDKIHFGWGMFGHLILFDLTIGLSTEEDLTIGDGEIITFMAMVGTTITDGITFMDGQILILLVIKFMAIHTTEMDIEGMEDIIVP